MKKRMRQYQITLCVSAFAFLVGCAGEDVGFGASALGQDAHNLLLGDVAPLVTIEAERWEPAFAGCEGLLDTVQEYGVAEGQPELIVGLDIERHIVCVDTYASVENELSMRSSDDVDALWLGYVATLQTIEADHTGHEEATNDGAEPEPQTNNGAEPEPQTNDGAEPQTNDGAEPEPQTNDGAEPEPQTNDGAEPEPQTNNEEDCVDDAPMAAVLTNLRIVYRDADAVTNIDAMHDDVDFQSDAP